VRALLAVLLLAACRDKAPPPPAQKPPVVDPWAAKDAGPAKSKEELAKEAVARVGEIEPKLAKLRHLSLDQPIPAEYQSKEAFRDFVHKEVEKDAAHAKDETAALIQIGLLPAGVDLAKAEEQAFATQAAAYYDPAQKKFFIVQVPDAPALLDITSAHELTHGLQDQHFHLSKYIGEDASGTSKLDSDVQTARRFVVEGDATFTMFLYAMGDLAGAKDPSPEMLDMLAKQLGSMGDTDAMVDSMMEQTGMGSGEFADAAKAMKEIPKAILVPMIDSYMKGALVSLEAYKQGGWPAVDALYANPPDSSEQVLHPKEKLLGKRDKPMHVTLPKLKGYDEVMTDVLGELQWQVYFGLWKHEPASKNWGGDRFALERSKDGKQLVVIATAWDSAADAKAFSDAYQATVPARLGAAGHTGKIWVKLDGTRVLIVDGGEDPAVMDALVAGAKIDR